MTSFYLTKKQLIEMDTMGEIGAAERDELREGKKYIVQNQKAEDDGTVTLLVVLSGTKQVKVSVGPEEFRKIGTTEDGLEMPDGRIWGES